ncbi:nadh dehydrogenase subunit 1, partial [Phaffia rhodozyma]
MVALVNAFLILPMLLGVAFSTIAERKGLAAMQRRVGPNTVGAYGVLQPFADALKLMAKEFVQPTQALRIFVMLAPLLSLICSLLGFAVVPFGRGLAIYETDYSVLVLILLSTLTVYGVLYAGWSTANSFAFVGALRAAAQMISYELTLGTAVLVVVAISGSMSLATVVEVQQSVW